MITDLTCSTCATDAYVEAVGQADDGRIKVRCSRCGTEWTRGRARERPTDRKPSLPSLERLRTHFPGPDDVDPARLAHVRQLKRAFLDRVQPAPDPAVARHWAKYQRVFSADGLPRASAEELKAFANIPLGARPGNMSVFNRAWNELGDEEAARKLRGVIEYLLRGPAHIAFEDRLTTLITDREAGMQGFRESLLTKVLCVVEDQEYLPILTYTSPASGKREVAQGIWGLTLPDPHRVTWTIGRLIVWSNRLLLALVGEGFATVHHAAEFLWWANRLSHLEAPPAVRAASATKSSGFSG